MIKMPRSKLKKPYGAEQEKIIENIMAALREIQEDTSVPKNVKNKLNRSVAALQEKCDICLRVDKALQELDEIANDSNLQPYTRTQIWNVVSMLEKL